MEIKYPIPEILKKSAFYEDLKILIDCLSDKSTLQYSRLVGGCVRDLLLSKISSDVDICTPLIPDEVIYSVKKVGAHAIPTGIKHGTVTVILNGNKFEITTLREDIECDGRHASVEFAKDFELDARRRDFTINAMSYCIKSETLYDYFGGLEDLRNRRVIFIGNPEARINEDALRIMRFFRFSSYYSEKIDNNGYEMCLKHAHLLKNLSQERITSELNKILVSPRAVDILIAMKPILDIIGCGKIDIELLEDFIIYSQNSVSLELRYAILFSHVHDIKEFLAGLKLSKNFIKSVSSLYDCLLNLQKLDVRSFLLETIYRNKHLLSDYLIILKHYGKLEKSIEERILELASIDLHKFPVSGYDIMSLGISGSEVGVSMKKLENFWINSEFRLNKKELLSCLKKF